MVTSVTLVYEGENTKDDIEAALRIVLAEARAKSADNRRDHPASGRAWSLVATHIEEALYRILTPVP